MITYTNERHQQHKNYDQPSKNPYDPNRSRKGWVLRQPVGNVLKAKICVFVKGSSRVPTNSLGYTHEFYPVGIVQQPKEVLKF